MFGRFLLILLVAAFAVGVVTRASQGGGRGEIYVVKPADTLWSIAVDHYGGDPREGVWRVSRANHLGSAAPLRPGERLVLP